MSHSGTIHPTSIGHAGGIHLVIMSHIEIIHPAFEGHARGNKITTTSHDRGKYSSNASHFENGDTIEKPTQIGCKPKFFCNICKGCHLTQLCTTIGEVQRVCYESRGYYSPEQPMISQQPIQPLVDQVVEPM